MAKVTSPLYGIDAAGALGGSVVFAKWKGVKYARRFVIPANPRTEAQMLTRNVFSFLNQLWAQAPGLLKEPWEAYSKGQPLTDRNAFIKVNVPQLREESDISTFVLSPGVGGGFALAGFEAEGGLGTITASVEVPELPSGWSVAHVACVVVTNQDPHEPFTGTILADKRTSEPYDFTFSVSAGVYVVSAYAKYTKPDGKAAFSPSLIAVVEVS